jgi:hypothetical protein
MNAVTPDLTTIDGFRMLPAISEERMAGLRIKIWFDRGSDDALPVQPSSVDTLSKDTQREITRDDGVDQKRETISVAAPKADAHPGVCPACGKALDLGKARHLDLGDELRPVVEDALPAGEDVGIEEKFGHGLLPEGER